MKKILTWLLIAAIVGTAYLFLTDQALVLTNYPIITRTLRINENDIKELQDTSQAEFETFQSRTQQVSTHAAKVLGSSVEISEEQPPVHERALEYGKYLYCKEVVKQYESNQEKN